jgi:hypothetical protein
LFRNDAVKQNKPHPAVQIGKQNSKQEKQYDRSRNNPCDQGCMRMPKGGKFVKSRFDIWHIPRATTLPRVPEAARSIATATGTELSSQKSDYSQPGPLPKTKWLEKLLFSMLDCGTDSFRS